MIALEALEALADEIAHDLVPAPEDDATEAEIARALRAVEAARAAALAALLGGAHAIEAERAAERRLGEIL